MTRRKFFSVTASAGPAVAATPSHSRALVMVPVQLIVNRRVKWRPGQLDRFWSRIWPETIRDLERCGIRLQSNLKAGDVRRYPGGQPVITGLDHGVINLVITDRIPIEWDEGLALSGVTTRYHGNHLCMIALEHAHCHELPFLSVNTCVHELLHALLQDIFEGRPDGLPGEVRELRIDWYATLLWLFHGGPVIRTSAAAYVQRLRSDFPGPLR